MSDKELIKQEIEYRLSSGKYSINSKQALEDIIVFIYSLPEEPCCEIDLTAENENKNFEEIDRYCTLCMDINCSGCQYHDIHFRNIIKNGTIH